MVYNVYQIQICFKPYTSSMCKYKHNTCMSFVLENVSSAVQWTVRVYDDIKYHYKLLL